jgi:sigma-E factor negative regulatory protein RseC
MLTEQARVVALDAETVWVETIRQSSCGSCSARAGCGHGMLNTALPGSSRALVKAALPGDLSRRVNLHDIVEIALPEHGFLRAATLLYLMPLLTTVGGAVIADAFWVTDGGSQAAADARVLVAAALGLLAGLGSLRFLSQRLQDNPLMQPRVTAKLG